MASYANTASGELGPGIEFQALVPRPIVGDTELLTDARYESGTAFGLKGDRGEPFAGFMIRSELVAEFLAGR